MNFNEWWESITEPERKIIGRTNAKYVWVCAQEAEREECAQMFDDPVKLMTFVISDDTGNSIHAIPSKHVASAIRARSNP